MSEDGDFEIIGIAAAVHRSGNQLGYYVPLPAIADYMEQVLRMEEARS